MLGPTIPRKPVDEGSAYGHSRTRTVSSNNPIPRGQLHEQQAPQYHLAQLQPQFHNRRSPSVNTFSTTSSIPPPAAYRKSSASDLRRSESSRSGGTTANSGNGYVALLRKQKATVWCDRAQYEDPKLVAQQRAAKKRANLEVVGGARSALGAGGSRTSTGISATGKVAAKIRHHGKAPIMGLTPGENHVGVGGVPLRLSATEVEAESSDDEGQTPMPRGQHRRTGSSGRSSVASGRRGIPFRTSGGQGSLHSQRRSAAGTPERSGSIVEDPTGEAASLREDSASITAHSTRSGSSGERADNVGELNIAPRLASNSLMHSALTREKSVKNPEELRRRGSVDERTTTFNSAQRLYIANPD